MSVLLSEFKSTIAKSATESVILKNEGLASRIDQFGLTESNIIEVLSAFRDVCEGFTLDKNNYKAALTTALSEADSILSDEKDALRKRMDSDIAAAQKDKDKKNDTHNQIIDSRNQSIVDLQAKQNNLKNNLQNLNWLDRKMSEKSTEEEVDKLEREIDDCRKMIEEVNSAIAAAEEYFHHQVDEIKASHSRLLAEKEQEYKEFKTECNKLNQDRQASLDKLAKQFIEEAITEDILAEVQSAIGAIRPDYENYQVINPDSFTKPGELYLGFIRWRTQLGGSLCQINRSYIAHSPQGSLFALPLVVNLSDGFQIIIKPSGSNDAFWDNDCVRAIALKLLMAYPPGKLQLTLIDSFKNGISFSGIPDIADKHHENVISGGVLTETEFIAQALRSLRTKMGNYSGNQGYGRDKQSYFRREPIQAVVINDFPNGFNEESLADLARLMENGDAFGMVFVIGMNPSYEAEFANNANYKSILARRDAITVEGSDLQHLTYKDTGFEFIFGDHVDVIDNADAVIKTIRSGVITAKARVEPFSQLFPNTSDWEDENTWRRKESSNGVMIPLGVSGASQITQVVVGMPGPNIMHHGLITGPTGAGKSTALHTMIMSTIMNYPPDEVQLVLIDFKEGTEFRSYAPYQIPNFRSITTTTEPEFALAALQDVKDLYENRTTIMTDINEYRRDNDMSVPKVLVLFDEVQALFSDGVKEDIKNECLEILTLLVTKGRAMGIHIFLASQSFERVSCIQPLMSDMKIRLCLKDTNTGGILQDASALRDASMGSAILNNEGGAPDKNDLFQVCILEDDKRDDILRKLSRIYDTVEMQDRYKSFDPRLLFTNIEDDFHHPFNTFIEELRRPETNKWDPILRIGSLLKIEGDAHPYRKTGYPFNVTLSGENLLLIGDNSSVAKSIFIFSILSALLDSLSRDMDKDDRMVLFDFTEDNIYSDENENDLSGDAAFDSLYDAFPGRIKHVQTSCKIRRSRRTAQVDMLAKPPMEAEIDTLYAELERRKGDFVSAADPDNIEFSRLFLMFYGINSALRLANTDSQEGGMYGNLSTLAKLQAILDEGPLYDIYSIAWGQTMASTEKILNFNSVKPAEAYFQNRIVFCASDDEFSSLAACVTKPSTSKGAAFCNINNNERVHIRPFDPPKLGWVDDFRCCYDEAERQS